MPTQQALLLRLGVAAALLTPSLLLVRELWGQQPQSTVIDLKFTERKEVNGPWYGFGLDEGGQCSRPFGDYGAKLLLKVTGDKVQADTDGNGAIDDKDAPAVTMPRGDDYRDYARIKIPLKVGKATVQYPFCVRFLNATEGRTYLLVASAALLEGQFGQYTIRITDGDQNGQFGSTSDQVMVIGAGSKDLLGDSGHPWSSALAFDGKIHELKLLDNGARLRLTPYTGPVAEVRLQFSREIFDLRAILQDPANQRLGTCSDDGTALLIPGNYRLYQLYYRVGGRPASGPPPYLSGSHPSDGTPIRLKAGQNIVKVGPPLKMTFTATRHRETVQISTVSVAGQGGETYRPYMQPERGDSFAAWILAGGKEQKLGDLGFS